ncbi:small G protein signaling modulator 2-like isoform X1 [Dermacentor albipictus]|uniref:small G protein signaling modulator 2-like isoform X1 n=2 Tax=Dermacentor albipictus TaxID=60249 RepID=UPI0038FC477A
MALASAPAAFSKSDSPTRIMTVFRSKSDDTSASLLSENEYREKLLRTVKKEVKQIMEEAVTRKFVHEESSSITSLCAAVDACLSHGLKRRALGLFKTNSTTALLHKMAKHFEPAAAIARAVTQMEAAATVTSDSSTTESRLRSQTSRRSLWATSGRYIWIRLALFEKQLASIVDHLVHNSSKYYEKDALVADPVSGQILASLLVGPCALDYSKMKTQDHFWTDPPADELVQRHRLSSGLPTSASAGGSATAGTPPPTRRLGLQCRRDLRGTTGGSSSEEGGGPAGRVVGASGGGGCDRLARDYVESLHQNARSTLLYGKNNVHVQPRCHTGEPLPGYLSLHQQGGTRLVLKWTPNQLMNGTTSGDSSSGDSLGSSQDKSIYWEYALSVNMEDIVYLHCHQQAGDSGGTLVLVGQDGVQRPPMHFPRGGHLLAFLSCLENGLLPNGQLDPPLRTHQSGTGKVFPRLRRRRAAQGEEEEGSTDFVFRVITSLRPHSLEDLLEGGPATSTATGGARTGRLLEARSSSSRSSESPPPEEESPGQRAQGQSLQLLCDTMKKQIISRAFYGWLAHCRHLQTVRTHLSGLVHPAIVSGEGAEGGLTREAWQCLSASGRLDDPQELHRLVYFGGVEHQVRPLVWPYLLGHYALSSLPEERKERDASTQAQYEATLSEWLAAEAMVRHREGLHTKLSSESTTSEIPLIGPRDTHLSNEVFEDGSSDSEGSMDAAAHDEAVCEGEEIAWEIDSSHSPAHAGTGQQAGAEEVGQEVEEDEGEARLPADPLQLLQPPIVDDESSCVSPASSSGGVYSSDLLDLFSLNLHRIDKDVQRCDRNYSYFTTSNLEKLRNVMCTYVWEHLDVGYVQGMCDLVAPLLVIFDDEMLTYSCFCELMKRMAANFPHGGAMDHHFANMRSLIQILDAEVFELMHQNGDYTHFYFCYRWFLLDFKRELVYQDVFSVWETIWAAQHVASSNFVLFIALAMVEYYRDIILENNMDFTDIIKFFNEMAERHDAKAVLQIARELVLQIQTLIDNR